ncbi:MAG: hypothetical protein NTV70_14975 [Acidobacteria bacterium]|nr:hypothetical protein [Acidobacteriota bacterium]
MIGSAAGLSGAKLEHVRLLGARINLFVSLYDHVLDSGTPAEQILSADFESGSSCPLIPTLIRGLFAEVGREELLLEGMRRMAHGKNHYRYPPVDTLQWRRKNGLIPVVMALAVRKATRSSSSMLRRWCGQVPQRDLVDAFFYCATREIHRATVVPA